MKEVKLLLGDCLDKLKELETNSVDSVVTDPPYELNFMNKGWDNSGIAFNKEVWSECLRVLKPGGYILAFGGTRTYHRMTVAIEDAGFEIRDCIAWMYGSGFPKSHNIGKAIDKLEGNEREVVGERKVLDMTGGNYKNTFDKTDKQFDITKGNSPYEGWGTALKPAFEPVVMGRKPLEQKTVAENVLEWGTGGINIDDCRIGNESRTYDLTMTSGNFETTNGGKNIKSGTKTVEGRFPANVILDEVAGKILDEQSGKSKSSPNKWEGDNNAAIYGKYQKGVRQSTFSDQGGASRFFYCPKTSKSDRNEGCETIQPKSIKGRDEGQDKTSIAYKARPTERSNTHPTVKPTDLMRYLVRLITPKGGTVLDPFMGSGSTGKGAVLEGMNFVGIERETEYYEIAQNRISAVNKEQHHEKFFE
jgi:site-specific DNA-methyltransferase (adenine-specific)